MDNPSEELTIELVDLQELARINPMAWEQLLHIVDNRQNAARITELESHLETAHGFSSSQVKATNNGVASALE